MPTDLKAGPIAKFAPLIREACLKISAVREQEAIGQNQNSRPRSKSYHLNTRHLAFGF